MSYKGPNALVLGLYHLYARYFGLPDAHTFRSIHLSLILVLTFLTRPLAKEGSRSLKKLGVIVDCILIGLVIACQVSVSYDVIELSNLSSAPIGVDPTMRA